jgi:hypothetical protein
MGIVRARAVWITRSTTGTTFPALIPLLDLIPHRPGSGGSMKLGVDNVVTVTSGKTFTGGKTFEVFIDRETNATDADLLLAHHALAPGTNPNNAVRMRLPGTEISRVGVIRKIELLRSWRKEVSYFNFCMGNCNDVVFYFQMAMPPRGSDLWRGAKGLGLYGDGDEDELSAMEDTKKKKRGRKRAIAALAAKEGGGGSMTIEVSFYFHFIYVRTIRLTNPDVFCLSLTGGTHAHERSVRPEGSRGEGCGADRR